MKKNIYLIRHGQTDYNLKGIVQGRGVNSHLNNTGRNQAKKFFNYYKNVRFDAIYASTLQRTHQTVEPFLTLGLKHEVKEALDEIDWGIFEGVEHDQILEGTYFSIIESWTSGDLHVKIEGGESPLELQARQSPFIEELRHAEYENVLICSHGRAIRALLCGFLDIPLSEMDNFKHNNTCLYKLSVENGVFNVEISNDISHLTLENAEI